MAISKTIPGDYAADDTGVADAAPAFYTGLRPDMAGQDCNLTISPGTFRLASAPGGGGAFWATGMTSLNVSAAGATLTGVGPPLGSLHMTQIGIDEAAGKSARIQSVSAGATSVTLTAASASAGHISRAVAPRWMIVTGFDIQGLFQAAYGFPPNAHFVEFVQITGVVGDTISFTPALQESYSDQWPEMNRGSAFEPDGGGPATVYFLHPDWDHTTVFDGITLDSTNLVNCQGKDFTIINGEHSGGAPVFPSVNKIWRAIDTNTNSASSMELDKLVDTATFDGGLAHKFHTQSSSIRLFNISNCTMNQGVDGTPRNAVIENCVLNGNLGIGPTSYGRGDTFVCRNSTITGTISGGLTEKGPADEGVQAYMQMSGGVITIPKAMNEYATRVFPPDSRGRNVLFWQGGQGRILGGFKVLSVTSDPWPAADDQSSTTNVTSTNTSKTITVSSDLFTSGDINKVILVPGARVDSLGNSATLRSFITGVSAFSGGTQNITVYHAASRSQSAVSQSVRWGTSNVYVHTDQSGGFPDSSLYDSGKLYIRVPPARTVSFENVTGSDHAVDLSQVAAQNRPLWSYTKRTYDGTTSGAGGTDIPIYGNVVSVKINVTKAYTGSQGTLNMGFQQFNLFPVIVNGVGSTYGPRVNLKIVGERVITVGSTTGAQSLDTNLDIPSARWFAGSIRVAASANITGEDPSVYPSFTVEIITDQGFATAPTAVAPLRLRLRAA